MSSFNTLLGGNGRVRGGIVTLWALFRPLRHQFTNTPYLGRIYAPLVFMGRGLVSGVIGCCLWGLGMGVQESIIPAAVAPMVGPIVVHQCRTCSPVYMACPGLLAAPSSVSYLTNGCPELSSFLWDFNWLQSRFSVTCAG